MPTPAPFVDVPIAQAAAALARQLDGAPWLVAVRAGRDDRDPDDPGPALVVVVKAEADRSRAEIPLCWRLWPVLARAQDAAADAPAPAPDRPGKPRRNIFGR